MSLERLAALSLALLTSSPALLAQERSEPPRGARMRIQTIEGRSRWIQGTLVALDEKELTLQRGKDGPMTIGRGELRRLEVSAGHGRKKGATIGALVGLALAGGFTLLNAASSGDDLCSGSGCVELFLLLGVPAAIGGGVVGAVVAPERWSPMPLVPTPASTSGPLTLAPARGGGLSARLAFRF